MNPRVLYISLLLSAVIYVNHVEQSQQLPMVKTDYSACFPTQNGPIARPDHYSTNPHGRRKDFA